MANWYSGVLNTGKRRYGHPALNGVLPQPWLPLKKGQTLVNRDRSNGTRSGDAVVLTMRRRYSQVPRGSRIRKRSVIPLNDTSLATTAPRQEQDAGTSSNAASNGAPSNYGAVNPVATTGQESGNPWADSSSRLRPTEREPLLHRRLSFDDASGVIMLSDDWMMEDIGSDSDSEEFTTSPGPSRETSTAHDNDEPVHSHSDTEAEVGTATPRLRPLSTPDSPETKRRHATYFHHPERRRQTIPGAFPGAVGQT
jgi:hypothetical protein